MFRNQINEILEKKIIDLQNYLRTHLNVDSFDYRTKCFFVGGCITSMLLNEKVNDYDIYFSDEELVIQIKHLYSKRHEEIKKYNIPDDQLRDFDPVYISKNAIGMKNKIQLITRFIDTPEKIMESFDFLHCKNYFSVKDQLVTSIESLECILAKRLIYTGSEYPLASLIRVRKFLNKGWYITAGQLLKIAYDINRLDMHDYDVLKDQLKGVDVSYFGALIENMEKQKDNLSEIKIFEMIDQFFEYQKFIEEQN